MGGRSKVTIRWVGKPTWILFPPRALPIEKEIKLKTTEIGSLTEMVRPFFMSFLYPKTNQPNIMNILRPLSPQVRRFLYAVLIIFTLLLLCYFLCLTLGSIALFQAFLCKMSFFLGGRTLSFALFKLGCSCSAGLALTVGFALQALLTGEGFTNMMAPAGDSGATWKEDTREIDILLESSWETEDTGSSVNQPVAPPVPPANPVASPGEDENKSLKEGHPFFSNIAPLG